MAADRAVTLAVNVVAKGGAGTDWSKITGQAGKGAGGPGMGSAAGAGGGGMALAGAAIAAAAVVMVLDKLIQFASKANPAGAMMLTDAIDDLQGVLGEILAPLLDVAADAVRAFADALVPVIELITPFVQMAAKWAQGAIEDVTGALGVRSGASFGADQSKAQASFIGVSELAKSTQLTAFRQGGRNPAEETAANTKRIADAVTRDKWADDGKKRAQDGFGGGGGGDF